MFKELRDPLREKFTYYEQDIRDEDVLDLSRHDIPTVIQNSTSFKLYRYMSPEYFNIRNIETQTIHLSANGDMNDIYEGLVRDYDESDYIKFQKLSNMAYMTCFTETNDDVLMWSHYAKNHTGFCVEYDLKLLQRDNYKTTEHLLPVVYDDSILLDKDIDLLIDNHKELGDAIKNNNVFEGDVQFVDVVSLFLIKGEKWQYENEWRILYTLKQIYDMNDDVLYSKNIPFKCISAVYLGVRIHPEIRQNIIEICHRISTSNQVVKIYQAKMSTNRSIVEFEEIHQKEGLTK